MTYYTITSFTFNLNGAQSLPLPTYLVFLSGVCIPFVLQISAQNTSSRMSSLSTPCPWFEQVSWYRFSKFPVFLTDFGRFCIVIVCSDVYASLLDYTNPPGSLRQMVSLEHLAYYLLQGHRYRCVDEVGLPGKRRGLDTQSERVHRRFKGQDRAWCTVTCLCFSVNDGWVGLGKASKGSRGSIQSEWRRKGS